MTVPSAYSGRIGIGDASSIALNESIVLACSESRTARSSSGDSLSSSMSNVIVAHGFAMSKKSFQSVPQSAPLARIKCVSRHIQFFSQFAKGKTGEELVPLHRQRLSAPSRVAASSDAKDRGYGGVRRARVAEGAINESVLVDPNESVRAGVVSVDRGQAGIDDID